MQLIEPAASKLPAKLLGDSFGKGIGHKELLHFNGG
jgi:hypothetical protein